MVAWSLPSFSASHLLVLPFSASITFMRLRFFSVIVYLLLSKDANILIFLSISFVIYENHLKREKIICYIRNYTSLGNEDHVGLAEYIAEEAPQYMSEGTKGLLEIKYDVIRQAADLKAHELLARKCDPQERSDALRHREEAESKCRLVDRMRVWKHTPSDVVAESISIGDIRVTPFSNCHSILHKDADAEL